MRPLVSVPPRCVAIHGWMVKASGLASSKKSPFNRSESMLVHLRSTFQASKPGILAKEL